MPPSLSICTGRSIPGLHPPNVPSFGLSDCALLEMSQPRLVISRNGTDYNDTISWVPGLLNLVQSLKSRADAWDDLEGYLKLKPDATYEGLNQYNHTLQARVFLHVDQALTPSTDKTYTGSLDSFTRVILMATGLLSSDDFESCEFVMKEMLERCEQLSPGARDAFEVLDTLQTLDLAPHIRELLAAPHVATLASLECITRQRESGTLRVMTTEMPL